MSIDHGKVLVACRRKLEAYRDAYGLEYVGGQELSSLLSDIDRALAQPAEAVWLDGAPTGFRADEWFIARLKDGSRAVLIALPEEYAHDFKTADSTYYTRDWVVKWMPFPDSEFLPPSGQPAEAVELPTPYHYADGGKGEPLFTANQVRAAVAVATDAAQGAVADAPTKFVTIHRSKATGRIVGKRYAKTHPDGVTTQQVPAPKPPANTHPQAAPALMSSQDDWTVLDCPHCGKCVTYSKKAASSKDAYRDLTQEVESLRERLGQAAPAQGDGEMAKIGRLIETQDNRITEAPIFIVQQKRWICGVDPDYGGERVWINHARESVEITDEVEIARLDAEYAEEYTAPEGYTLTGKMHVWDFVTACFTEQGCKDYLARDGHNLCEPRIYAAGSYRNEEWRSVRKFLMSLAAAPSQEGES